LELIFAVFIKEMKNMVAICERRWGFWINIGTVILGGRHLGFGLNIISGNTGDMQQFPYQIWWKSLQRFRSYSRIKKFKMATIQDGGGGHLGFGLNTFSGGMGDTRQPLFQIWWKSAQRFKSYSRIKKYRYRFLMQH